MLDDQALDALKKWFDEYVSSFRLEDPQWQRNIDIKVEHSLRVCEAIREIGLSLNLGKGELNLAEAAALFHDVGRFEQFRQFGTFSDHRSVNHAELGVRILEDKRALRPLSANAQEIILHAVSNHNRFSIPDGESETHRFYSRLLRDADKLDIWRVVNEHYSSEDGIGNGVSLGLPNTPGVSGEVYRDLMQRKLVRMNHLRNENDFKLLQIGWVYDVNFHKTLELVRERGYLGVIRNSLKPCKEVDDVYSAVTDYMDRKVMENSIPSGSPFDSRNQDLIS